MQVEGTIERLFFANDDAAAGVLSLGKPIPFPDGMRSTIRFFARLFGAEVGDRVSMEGEYVNTQYGYQLQASSARIYTDGIVDIKSVLLSGFIKGVGPALAEKIVVAFGEDTERVVSTDWERLAEVPGITLDKAKTIHNCYNQSSTVLELISFFGGEATRNQINTIYKKYGDRAVETIQRNPYRIIEIDGFGFKKADELAKKSGIDANDPMRVKAAIYYAMETVCEEGHCYYNVNSVRKKVNELVEGITVSDDVIADQIAQMINSGDAVLVDNDKLYLTNLLNCEKVCAGFVKKCLKNHYRLYDEKKVNDALDESERRNGISYELRQKNAVHNALKNSISVVTGGPGTGKTTVINAIISAFIACGGKKSNIHLAAPTGKASRRMKESTGLEATTIHRMCGCNNDKLQLEDFESYLFVIDESSMIDIFLASKMFRTIDCNSKSKVWVVLIGDVDQLPPIGPGCLFRELVDSPIVPTTTLLFTHRFGGAIATNADLIKKGRGIKYFSFGPDFVFKELPKESTGDAVVEAYLEAVKASSVKDVQVIVPMKTRSNTGSNALNMIIREKVNPDDGSKTFKVTKTLEFRINDRVMQTKNDDERDVYNGDCGNVTEIYDAYMVVTFDDGRKAEYTVNEAKNLTYSYVITIHKAQGTEQKTVITCFTFEHYIMLQRNLLYTAISRAKEKLIMFGEAKAVDMAIRKVSAVNRNSLLKRWMIQE